MINNEIKYLKSKIKEFSSELETLYKKADVDLTGDDYRVSIIVEQVIESMKESVSEIEFFEKPTIEGFLGKNENGRFVLVDRELHCGSPIELYIEKYDKWDLGRIESSDEFGGYYFFNKEGLHQKIEEGMKARTRVR